MKAMPAIERKDGQWKLLVDGKPMILLAGEVHNSSTSSLAYMEEVFDKGKQLGMNCLLLPVTWELIEPEEGHFDFSLVDGLIEQARARKMKIGLLWFGSWKNAQSTYAPEWVKTDLERFRRAQIEKGKNYVTVKKFYNLPYSPLSYLCEETMQADARAFAALMAEIRRVDSEEHTVVTVQVENETGLMAGARDHSDEADAIFNAPVPADFAAYMYTHTGSMVPEVREAVRSGRLGGSWGGGGRETGVPPSHVRELLAEPEGRESRGVSERRPHLQSARGLELLRSRNRSVRTRYLPSRLYGDLR